MSILKKNVLFGNDKKQLPYLIEDISIHQSHYSHHTFDISLSILLNQQFGVADLKAILGEKIEINFYRGLIEKNTFIGFVDSAKCYYSGGSRILRLEGYSPSMLMDAGPRFRTFSEQSLKSAVDNIFSDYSKYDFTNNSSGEIKFKVQCQESDFKFLNRLADDHSLNFFYDGEQFLFDDLCKRRGDVIELSVAELSSLEASVNLVPLDFSIRGYNLIKDEIDTIDSDEGRYESNEPLVKAATNKSSVYPKVQVGLNHVIEKEDVLKPIEEQLATQQTNDLVTIRGRSTDIKLRIGSTIQVKQKAEAAIPGIEASSYFIITHLSHSISEENEYHNSFTAIPADHPFSINIPNTKSPICAPLIAIVKENTNDPDGLGRVRVQFVMDSNENRSTWMRVLTPHSSFNGTFWLPEIGEKVVVFFEDFNPEKSAFVLGSFFTGSLMPKNWNEGEKGFSLENISMIFNDKTGELKINAKSIKLEAETEISSEAENIISKATEEIKLSGGKCIKQDADRIDLN